MTALQRVCVYCGSSTGLRPVYAAAARALGHELANREIGLVYGGAHVGLMGVLADACLAAGGQVVGVIPAPLIEAEIAHTGLTELHVVASMAERKARMGELADAFIALPGGFGTLEELFETVTAVQIGLHAKPCGLLDVDGFFEPLLVYLDHAVAEGLLRADNRAIVVVDDEAGPLLDRLGRWAPTHRPTWA
jgi:uncharacterized protein (TIGR00730 family)